MNHKHVFLKFSAAALAHLAIGHALAVAPAAGPDLSEPSTIAAGAKRFNQNCVYCHGNAGSGGKAAPLQGRSDLGKEYIFNTVSNGKTRGAFMMPAWKASFNEQEIWELTAFILSLKNMAPPQ